MLNLFDYLTEEDNTIIKNYISLYGAPEDRYVGNETWLKFWKENKPKLFHLLGGNLIYKMPYSFKRDRRYLEEECTELFRNHEFARLLTNAVTYGDSDNAFNEQLKKAGIESDYSRGEICCAVRSMIYPDTLTDGRIDRSFKFKIEGKRTTLQISTGMKPMKALQKVLNYMDCFSQDEKLMDSFKDFERRYSIIFNTKKIECNICFSIHPMDYMTASDNANRWSSCMNWTHDGGGCYHAGTVEMMNSNNVICVYLEGSTPFCFNKDLDPEDPAAKDYTWNSKRWRQFFYCTKEIIVSGKAYPYAVDDITKFALETLRKLAKENWNHTYEFGIEPYLDMIHIFSKHRMDRNRLWIFSGDTKKHNIIFDTKGMYNDMLNDQDTQYYCIRNKVKKNIIMSYSGKAPCLCCMNDVVTEVEYGTDEYNDRYDHTGEVVCADCLKKYTCDHCGTAHRRVKKFGDVTLCEKCWKERVRICPDCGKPYILGYHYDDNSWCREHNLFIRNTNDPESNLTYYKLSYPNPLETGVYKDEDGIPRVSLYNCCPECREKLKLSNDTQTTVIEGLWGHRILIWNFTKVIPFESDLVQKHLTKNLQAVPFD